MTNPIQFVGLKELSEEETSVVTEVATAEYEKLMKKVHNITSALVHLKVYGEGQTKKFAVHVRINLPSLLLESCKSHDWDLPTALHKSFEDIAHQAEHKLKLGGGVLAQHETK